MKKQAIIVTLLIAALSLGWWSWQLHGQVGQLTEEIAQLRPQLEQARKLAHASAAEAARRPLPAVVNEAAVSGADDSAEAEAANNARKRNFHPEELVAMVKAPGMQSVIASQQSAMIQLTYRDLMERFQLTPEERDYMQKLLTQRQMNRVTLGMQLLNPALPQEERSALIQQLRETETSMQAKMRGFLNDDADYAAYQSYLAQEPERREIGMFESGLAGGDALPAATADALASLIGETRKQFPFTVDFNDESNFGRPQNLNRPTVDKFLDEQVRYQAELAEKAADLLTPAQLEAFKQNQAAMRQMSKMQLNSILQVAGSGL